MKKMKMAYLLKLLKFNCFDDLFLTFSLNEIKAFLNVTVIKKNIKNESKLTDEVANLPVFTINTIL